MKPKPGDLTVCFRCVAVLRFDKTLRLRAVSDAMLRRLCTADPGLAAELSVLQQGLIRFHEDSDRAGFIGHA